MKTRNIIILFCLLFGEARLIQSQNGGSDSPEMNALIAQWAAQGNCCQHSTVSSHQVNGVTYFVSAPGGPEQGCMITGISSSLYDCNANLLCSFGSIMPDPPCLALIQELGTPTLLYTCYSNPDCIDETLIYQGVSGPNLPCDLENLAPVCGCDGHTYMSDCIAEKAAGVTFSTSGACTAQQIIVCAGESVDLGLSFFMPNEYHNWWPAGLVTIDENNHWIAHVSTTTTLYHTVMVTVSAPFYPDFVEAITVVVEDCIIDCIEPTSINLYLPCIDSFDPVCGCDGYTYENSCFAEISGITSYAPGPCAMSTDCAPAHLSLEDWFITFSQELNLECSCEIVAYNYNNQILVTNTIISNPCPDFYNPFFNCAGDIIYIEGGISGGNLPADFYTTAHYLGVIYDCNADPINIDAIDDTADISGTGVIAVLENDVLPCETEGALIGSWQWTQTMAGFLGIVPADHNVLLLLGPNGAYQLQDEVNGNISGTWQEVQDPSWGPSLQFSPDLPAPFSEWQPSIPYYLENGILQLGTSAADGSTFYFESVCDIEIEITQQPLHGDLVINADNTITYTADLGYSGEDHFTYQICSNGPATSCDEAQVVISVTHISEPFSLVDDEASGLQDQVITICPLTNDNVAALSVVSISITQSPANGSLYQSNDCFAYTPTNGFVGEDAFIYQICNNINVCETATVHIVVDESNGISNPHLKTKLLCYPSPAQQYVLLNLSGISAENVSVYNHQGQLIYNRPVNNHGVQRINTAHWPEGIYFVGVQTSEGLLSGRVEKW